MSSFASKTTEDDIAAMHAWWSRNYKVFSEWFGMLEDSARLTLIHKGCPDIPKLNAQAREKSGESLKATDVLLPELTEDALMAANGKICVLFLTRRCTNNCVGSDLKLLYNLEIRKQLPRFNLGNSTAELDKVDTPFIDPSGTCLPSPSTEFLCHACASVLVVSSEPIANHINHSLSFAVTPPIPSFLHSFTRSDPDENIRSLGPETTSEVRKEVNAGFAIGRFATLNSWMALKIRRTAIAQFIKVLMEGFEEQADEMWKPKPCLNQLLDAELMMKAASDEATEAVNASSLEELS